MDLLIRLYSKIYTFVHKGVNADVSVNLADLHSGDCDLFFGILTYRRNALFSGTDERNFLARRRLQYIYCRFVNSTLPS